jgi:hypothetical protein
MSTQRNDERRKGTRTPVDFFVQVREGEHIALHPATDLSTTGLYLLASDDHRSLDPGRPLDLELTLPTGTVVRTRAHIAYIDDRYGQRGLGVEFSELGAADHQAIERFVDASSSARRRLG